MSERPNPSHNSKRFRIVPEVWAGILIVLSLLATGVLALNAVYLDRGHRRAAESVLTDYATFAAQQFGSRFEAVLVNRVVAPIQYRLRLLDAADPTAPLPKAEDIPIDTTQGGYGVVPQAAATIGLIFRIQQASDSFDIEWSDSVSDRIAAWVRDTIISTLSGSEHVENNRLIFDSRPGSSAFLALAPGGGSEGGYFGYIGTTEHFDDIVDLALSYGSLLPSSLIRSADSVVVAVSVSSPASLIHSSDPTAADGFSGTFELSERGGGLTVSSTIDRDVAPMLIIGGVPSNRSPVLFGTLTVTALLAFGVIVILRRSRELARVRSDFVSGVSHELRTPLAQIRMFAETLRLGRVRSEEEKERSLRIIDQESVRLTHLVDNLLNFSRGDRGHPAINPIECNLSALIEKAVETFSPLAAQRAVRFRTGCDSTIQAKVDPEALQQVLINLMDNAVKYGPEGQTVFIGLRKEERNAIISVEDEGTGVRASDRDKVWKRFWRSEADIDTAITGTGIGLALVREIAELHGGTTRVESGAVGARFVFTLPLTVRIEGEPGKAVRQAKEAT